jgi:type I restriction enzyme S subunit
MSRLVPKLRFKEFSGEWKEKKLGGIVTIFKGKGISKNDVVKNGKIDCIRYGELYTEYREIIKNIKSKTNLEKNNLIFSKENDVIIPSSGETNIDIATAHCVLKNNVALGGDLNILRGNENGIFLAYYLSNAKKYDITKLAQGIAVVHLYASQLETLKLQLPPPKEQQKIASCLSSLDSLIEAQNKKVSALKQHKKGLMQQLFPAEGEREPKLRFKAFSGEWEKKELGYIGNTFNGLTGKTKDDFGIGKSYIQYMQVFSNSKIDTANFGLVAVKSDDKQNKVKYGDVFFTTSSETLNEIGFSSVLTKKVKDVYLNSFCFGYRPKCLDDLVPKFSQFFFRSETVRKGIINLGQGSIRVNISKVKFLELEFYFPKKQEQQKIANTLSTLDNLIEAQNQQINHLKQHKKGLIQQLFVSDEEK